MKKIVIIPGGFHPFHAGHASLYKDAVKAFPDADVYVAATNDTSSRPFPFAVKEKLAQLAGVAPGRFVQVKSPFGAEEITSKYDPNTTNLIFVKSTKNAKGGPSPEGPFPAEIDPATGKLPLVTRGANKGKPVSDRLQYYRKGMKMQPMSRHSYLAYLPTTEFGGGMTSGSEIRAEWPTLDDQGKIDRVMSLYPRTQTNPKLAQTVVKLLDAAIGGQQDVTEASYMSLDDYKNNLQKALPSIIEYYQDELGFTPSKEQLASAVKAAHATMQRTGDTEQAGESLEAVLDSFVPSNSSNKNLPKIDFKKNLLQVLQQKYPDAEFKIGPDRVESTDGQLSVIADTAQEGRYVGCFMWDVSTGPYKGALGLAVKQTTDQLLQANPGKKPALFISGDNQNPEAWSHIAKKLKYKLITDENELEEGSLNEFEVDGFGDNGDHRSKLLASVGRLFDAGNKVDWQVPGQMGHVTRVQDDGITMKKWKMPHSRMSFFLPMTDDSRDSKYTIKMVGPKHYAVVSAEQGVEEAINQQLAIGGMRASYQNKDNQPIDENPDYVEERRL